MAEHDSDSSGTLDKDEVKEMLRKLERQMLAEDPSETAGTEAEMNQSLEEIWTAVETDGDGRVSIAELTVMMKEVCGL